VRTPGSTPKKPEEVLRKGWSGASQEGELLGLGYRRKRRKDRETLDPLASANNSRGKATCHIQNRLRDRLGPVVLRKVKEGKSFVSQCLLGEGSREESLG